MTAGRQRVDWVTFFRQIRRPHGIRLKFPTFDHAGPEGWAAERRLLDLIQFRCAGDPFALRRSFNPGPVLIECVFSSENGADRVALAIGAQPVKPPLGWATGRELVGNDESLRRLSKFRTLRHTDAPARRPITDEPALWARPRAARPGPVSEALQRLGALSLEEQAAALFKTMTASADDRKG